MDGWVSLEVSPLLTHDTAGTVAAAKEFTPGPGGPTSSSRSRAPGGRSRHRGGDLRRRADQRDAPVFPGALPCRRRGVPAGHRAADRRRAETRRRFGRFAVRQPLGRRGQARVPRSCATGSASRSPGRLTRHTATCSTRRAGSALSTPARPQRLLWASTGTKDPKASDVLYVKALAAPFTVNTIPEAP